ncbi:tRNA (adenosine(37)-N6)-threonylcarbamoyltransferase complex transferase subunit TsaD [Candidatus Kaiserbacteria bacterium]|nr:tRNA (adenosine(37)-N6)-threonylcarbamoyltransferase complex transferase subunit TsaD [Candidatus Kaiserbacteria bacterium]
MHILGIETSADDTGVALIEAEGEGQGFRFKMLGNEVSSQDIHKAYGGIFPTMAKREHIKNLPALFDRILGVYETTNIDAVAVTVGPGLEPCLWTGITFAQELSEKWSVPIVPVNHMEGHILISMTEKGRLAKFDFPALALLISGGHTELVLMKTFGQYAYIGRTRDDAVGEAFDKVARLLGLSYPGGPEISRLALAARSSRLKADFTLPRPMIHSDNYDFSFAGLKTAVERYVQAHELHSLDREKIAREFEDAVTDVLVYKTLHAVEEFGVSTVIMGGGVSANKHIRSELSSKLEAMGSKLLVCPPEYSTDNGLMIALAGYFHALKKDFIDPQNLKANGNLKLC